MACMFFYDHALVYKNVNLKNVILKIFSGLTRIQIADNHAKETFNVNYSATLSKNGFFADSSEWSRVRLLQFGSE